MLTGIGKKTLVQGDEDGVKDALKQSSPPRRMLNENKVRAKQASNQRIEQEDDFEEMKHADPEFEARALIEGRVFTNWSSVGKEVSISFAVKLHSQLRH